MHQGHPSFFVEFSNTLVALAAAGIYYVCAAKGSSGQRVFPVQRLAGLIEEAGYRGILYGGLRTGMSPAAAMWLTAACFMLAHERDQSARVRHGSALRLDGRMVSFGLTRHRGAYRVGSRNRP